MTHNLFTPTQTHPSLSPGLSRQLLNLPPSLQLCHPSIQLQSQGETFLKQNSSKASCCPQCPSYLVGLALFVSSTYSSELLSYYTCAKWNFLPFFKWAAPSQAASGLFHKLFTLLGTLSIFLGPVLFLCFLVCV